MQKIILLLPLFCLIFCAAQEIETQSLISTQNIDTIQRVSTTSSYLCPADYVYLVNDLQVFNGVVCVNTTITDTQLQQGDCSPGWATISYDEVYPNTQQYCDMLGSGGVARVGFMGSLTANGCSLSDWDLSSLTQSICVQREIKDIQLVRSKDNVCGEGMVLVTPQEAQANQDAYCSLLQEQDTVRLADGGSMNGAGYSGGSGCKIRYGDRGDLSGALCRAILNSEPNQNENMPVSETTTIFNAEQPTESVVIVEEEVVLVDEAN